MAMKGQSHGKGRATTHGTCTHGNLSSTLDTRHANHLAIHIEPEFRVTIKAHHGIHVLVGNNHTADGSAQATKIAGARRSVACTGASCKGVAASPGRTHVMVVGAWNMIYTLVVQACRCMGGGH